MASRRMFSKDVVCSDRFLDMPASAQALYFQYGLEADDDGFVSAPKKILRLTNASDDDLKILVAKGFLIPFDSGVVVIRDWKINNYLRRDRYTPTRFKEEFEQLDTIDDTLIEFIHNIDWSKIVTNIQDALTNIQWIAIAEKILELLGYALGSITGALARLIGNLIAQGASEAYQYFEDKIKEAGGNVVDGILLGILDALLGIGSWIVDNVFKPILDGFKNAFGIHSPSTVMQEQGHYIIEGLLLGITDFLSKIKKKFEEIRNLVTEKMDNIKSSAVSKVNEMKKGLSDGVERIKESFRSGFSTLVGYVKSPINSIIRFINNFLYAIQTMQNSFANALNSMSISLPHWLEKLTGFSSVGFNVGYWSAPMVPYLAQGAVIPPNKEFMAVLGDQKSGNNIEAPESLIRRIVREESGNGKGSTYNVTAQVNRRTLFDLVLEEGKVRRTVTGRNPFETV